MLDDNLGVLFVEGCLFVGIHLFVLRLGFWAYFDWLRWCVVDLRYFRLLLLLEWGVLSYVLILTMMFVYLLAVNFCVMRCRFVCCRFWFLLYCVLLLGCVCDLLFLCTFVCGCWVARQWWKKERFKWYWLIVV